MKLLRTDDLLPLVVVVPVGAFALWLGYVGLNIASRAFDGGHHDNDAGVYLLFGGLMLMSAAIPGMFALLIGKAAGWRVLMVALPAAALLAVLGQILITDASRRGAEEHMRERQRDTSVPPIVGSPELTPPTPVATVSVGPSR